MKVYLLMIPVLFMYGLLQGETLRDCFERKNIVLEELAPALRVAVQCNDRESAIQAAVAVRDFSALDTILFSSSCDSVSMVKELKLAALTSVRHGYNVMTCSAPLYAAYILIDTSIYDEAFWMALKIGYPDVALSVVDVAPTRWSPLESFVIKQDVQPEMIEGIISIFPALIQYVVEKIEQLHNRQQNRDMVRGQLEAVYEPALAQVVDWEMRDQLKNLFITAYILIVGPDVFSRNMGPMHPLNVEARARVFLSLGHVSEYVCVNDVMGVITEHVDLENSGWLKLISEFNGFSSS